MVVGISGKKEMGIAVQAITQYADDCMGNGDYIEMVIYFPIMGMVGKKN